jgi:hypothetical protein
MLMLHLLLLAAWQQRISRAAAPAWLVGLKGRLLRAGH